MKKNALIAKELIKAVGLVMFLGLGAGALNVAAAVDSSVVTQKLNHWLQTDGAPFKFEANFRFGAEKASKKIVLASASTETDGDMPAVRRFRPGIYRSEAESCDRDLELGPGRQQITLESIARPGSPPNSGCIAGPAFIITCQSMEPLQCVGDTDDYSLWFFRESWTSLPDGNIFVRREAVDRKTGKTELPFNFKMHYLGGQKKTK